MSPNWHRHEYWLKFSSLDAGEPAHIHISSDGGAAKFWLDPVRLAANHGYNKYELQKAQHFVEEHKEWLMDEWKKFWERHHS